MANLLSIAELTWRQLFPNPGDETAIKKEQFIADAKTEYAYQLWLKILADRREDGAVEVPSYLLSETELDVINGEMDISKLKIMRSLPWEIWLQDVGGMGCNCLYVKSTLNHVKTLCDDDSLPDSAKRYYVVGKKIKFPDGTHKKSLPITYANNGEMIDDKIEVDDAMGALVRRALLELYGAKIGREDNINDSKSEA